MINMNIIPGMAFTFVEANVLYNASIRNDVTDLLLHLIGGIEGEGAYRDIGNTRVVYVAVKGGVISVGYQNDQTERLTIGNSILQTKATKRLNMESSGRLGGAPAIRLSSNLPKPAFVIISAPENIVIRFVFQSNDNLQKYTFKTSGSRSLQELTPLYPGVNTLDLLDNLDFSSGAILPIVVMGEFDRDSDIEVPDNDNIPGWDGVKEYSEDVQSLLVKDLPTLYTGSQVVRETNVSSASPDVIGKKYNEFLPSPLFPKSIPVTTITTRQDEKLMLSISTNDVTSMVVRGSVSHEVIVKNTTVTSSSYSPQKSNLGGTIDTTPKDMRDGVLDAFLFSLSGNIDGFYSFEWVIPCRIAVMVATTATTVKNFTYSGVIGLRIERSPVVNGTTELFYTFVPMLNSMSGTLDREEELKSIKFAYTCHIARFNINKNNTNRIS